VGLAPLQFDVIEIFFPRGDPVVKKLVNFVDHVGADNVLLFGSEVVEVESEEFSEHA